MLTTLIANISVSLTGNTKKHVIFYCQRFIHTSEAECQKNLGFPDQYTTPPSPPLNKRVFISGNLMSLLSLKRLEQNPISYCVDKPLSVQALISN